MAHQALPRDDQKGQLHATGDWMRKERKINVNNDKHLLSASQDVSQLLYNGTDTL